MMANILFFDRCSRYVLGCDPLEERKKKLGGDSKGNYRRQAKRNVRSWSLLKTRVLSSFVKEFQFHTVPICIVTESKFFKS